MHLTALFAVQPLLNAALVFFTAAKLVSSVGLLLLGDYRAVNRSLFRRLLSITGKVTPSCMLLTLAALQYVQGRMQYAAIFALLSALVGLLAFSMVRLRRQGRFYGLADRMTRFMTPRQVKLVLLLFFAFLALVATHKS